MSSKLKSSTQLLVLIIITLGVVAFAFFKETKAETALHDKGLLTVGEIQSIGGVDGSVYAYYTFSFDSVRYEGSSTIPNTDKIKIFQKKINRF